MRRIYKWRLDGITYLPWSPGDRVLLIAHQDGHDFPTLWAEQEDSNPPSQREFVVVGTGMPAPASHVHIGSAICPPFVWHVYAKDGAA